MFQIKSINVSSNIVTCVLRVALKDKILRLFFPAHCSFGKLESRFFRLIKQFLFLKYSTEGLVVH